MTDKSMEKPAEPFLYIAGRPGLPLEPVKYLYPESLTEEKGDALIKSVGEITKIKFDISPPYEGQPLRLSGGKIIEEKHEPYVTITATLEDYSKTKIGSDEDKPKEGLDWFYRFLYRAADDSLIQLLERKDKFIDNEQGYDGYLAHYGFERWGGLTIDIPLISSGKHFRTDVDIFASPVDKSHTPAFIVGLYSRRIEVLQNEQRERDNRFIAQVWGYNQDKERKLDEILSRIEQDHQNGPTTMNELMASLYPEEYEFFLPMSFRILALSKRFSKIGKKELMTEILFSFDLLKKYHLATESSGNEDTDKIFTEVFPQAKDFYLASGRGGGREYTQKVNYYFEQCVLLEYSIQKRRAKRRVQCENPEVPHTPC